MLTQQVNTEQQSVIRRDRLDFLVKTNRANERLRQLVIVQLPLTAIAFILSKVSLYIIDAYLSSLNPYKELRPSRLL